MNILCTCAFHLFFPDFPLSFLSLVLSDISILLSVFPFSSPLPFSLPSLPFSSILSLLLFLLFSSPNSSSPFPLLFSVLFTFLLAKLLFLSFYLFYHLFIFTKLYKHFLHCCTLPTLHVISFFFQLLHIFCKLKQ